MENSCKFYFLNIIVTISSFNPLNTNVNSTLKYYRKQPLNKKLKLMGGAIKVFTEMLSLALWFLGLWDIFWKFVKPSACAKLAQRPSTTPGFV